MASSFLLLPLLLVSLPLLRLKVSTMLSEEASDHDADSSFLDMRAVTKALQESEWRSAMESVTPQVKDQFLWEELEAIRTKAGDVLSGVYVLPSLGSLFGISCPVAKQDPRGLTGHVQHAAFKFSIKIPSSYPNAGLVDFHYLLMTESNPLGEWNSKEHRLHSLLVALKSLFYPNFNDGRIKELHGDPQVNPFQLFNPNFQGGGERAGVLKSSVQNERAISILTKNLMWWRKNGKAFPLPSQMIRLDDRPLSNEVEGLLVQLQDESLNFRHHVEMCVGESQDCLKYNLGSFFLRILLLSSLLPSHSPPLAGLRNDVLEVNSSQAQHLLAGDDAAAVDPDGDTSYGSVRKGKRGRGGGKEDKSGSASISSHVAALLSLAGITASVVEEREVGRGEEDKQEEGQGEAQYEGEGKGREEEWMRDEEKAEERREEEENETRGEEAGGKDSQDKE
ncbi:hypothetical protein GUITHDRAFT_143321 [Guillardia theta CCMP2712]|uniref:UBC core domain-containing protein n=1 Tax=Guillardia theta (strain CCMP2712) TaxID=905079 RepID=L1IV40_GUITC|nr:hypothetical protein GUITHDRAFT_143321 [Guillardia theta CCMP2712]EKX39749.1 hypothetical protein GUITHDRAFT_143321 [Guillardia theta CCMP2712]|eukprot:XP_005826729.1 hypothetical protein GUITHDRAFT_143321 [Guillardia theta CCMP2712]